MSYREVLDAYKGRCAVATSSLRAGVCVLSTSAVCAVSSCCSWCFCPNRSLSRCAGCRRVRYCSRLCQQRDWPQHRRECPAWRTIPKAITSPTVLLVTRLSAKLFLDRGSSDELQRVTQLRHHLDNHRDAKLKQFQEMTQLVLLLLSRWTMEDKSPVNKSFDELQQELETEILELFGRVNCNAFSLANQVTNEVVGLGLFPEGALFNHDCDPNCVVSFCGQQMQVRTVRDVEAGEELTVSYIELLQPTHARREELKNSYFFECACARCQDAIQEEGVQEDWFLDGLECGECEASGVGGVVVIDASRSGDEMDRVAMCKMCGAARDSQEIARYERELETIALVDANSEEGRWEKYQREWEIARHRLRLHPRSARVAAMAREIGNFLVDAKSEDLRRRAVPFLLAELRAVEWLLPQTQLPSRGLLHFQIGKLLFEEANTLICRLTPENQREQTEMAAKHLQQALTVLDCAYGSGSTAVQSAQMLFDDVQRAVCRFS